MYRIKILTNIIASKVIFFISIHKNVQMQYEISQKERNGWLHLIPKAIQRRHVMECMLLCAQKKKGKKKINGHRWGQGIIIEVETLLFVPHSTLIKRWTYLSLQMNPSTDGDIWEQLTHSSISCRCQRVWVSIALSSVTTLRRMSETKSLKK